MCDVFQYYEKTDRFDVLQCHLIWQSFLGLLCEIRKHSVDSVAKLPLLLCQRKTYRLIRVS